jgi:SHS2 domain-containing protein
MEEHSERRSESLASGHVWLDHTSEVSVRLHAPSLPELIAEGARAFAELVPDHMEGMDAPEPRSFRLDAGDDTATLVGWLNDLVYLAEVERWIPTRVDATWENTERRLVGDGPRVIRVAARGRTLDRPFVLVKAATFHGAGVLTDPRGLEAEITLDT